MTHHDNEQSTVQRLEYLVEKLRNQLTTAHIELAQRDDRIAELEQVQSEIGAYHIEGYDQIVRERNEARAVARVMADQCHDGEGFCRICIGRRGTHALDCPVSKVRAWDATATPPAEDTPGFSAAHNPDV